MLVTRVICTAVSSIIVVICQSQVSYMASPLGWYNFLLCDLRLTRRTAVREVDNETKRKNEGGKLKADRVQGGG